MASAIRDRVTKNFFGLADEDKRELEDILGSHVSDVIKDAMQDIPVN